MVGRRRYQWIRKEYILVVLGLIYSVENTIRINHILILFEYSSTLKILYCNLLNKLYNNEGTISAVK